MGCCATSTTSFTSWDTEALRLDGINVCPRYRTTQTLPFILFSMINSTSQHGSLPLGEIDKNIIAADSSGLV